MGIIYGIPYIIAGSYSIPSSTSSSTGGISWVTLGRAIILSTVAVRLLEELNPDIGILIIIPAWSPDYWSQQLRLARMMHAAWRSLTTAKHHPWWVTQKGPRLYSKPSAFKIYTVLIYCCYRYKHVW